MRVRARGIFIQAHTILVIVYDIASTYPRHGRSSKKAPRMLGVAAGADHSPDDDDGVAELAQVAGDRGAGVACDAEGDDVASG